MKVFRTSVLSLITNCTSHAIKDPTRVVFSNEMTSESVFIIYPSNVGFYRFENKHFNDKKIVGTIFAAPICFYMCGHMILMQ